MTTITRKSSDIKAGEIGTTVVRRYESLAEFVNHAESILPESDDISSWAGDESNNSSVLLARNGDESLVAGAEKLLEEIASVENHDGIAWVNSPAGAYPVVPEFIAGRPDCMRQQERVTDSTPISIYVCTTSSGGVGTETLLKRGTVILALLMKLQTIRPVELFLTVELGTYKGLSAYQVIPVDSKPLSISQAAYLLTSAGFARNLTYSVSHLELKDDGSWPWLYTTKRSDDEYDETMKTVLNMGDSDLYIKCAFLYDELLKHPVEWINAQLARYNNAND